MLKVMSFNLRFENDADGPNGWEFRKGLVRDLMGKHEPSLLGTQEGTPGQLRWLQENLEDYELYAPGRYWEETCQYCSLFYRRSHLRPVAGGEFWLSQSPLVHRSIGWDSAYPRMLSHAEFEDLESGRSFTAAVTHIDNIGVEARRRQAEIAGRFLSDRRGARVLMGDFNDSPGSAAHSILTSAQWGMADTWEVLGMPEDADAFTYHKFTGVPQVFRMDWILVDDEFEVSGARVIHDHGPDGRYPSDHFPYLVRLTWKK